MYKTLSDCENAIIRTATNVILSNVVSAAPQRGQVLLDAEFNADFGVFRSFIFKRQFKQEWVFLNQFRSLKRLFYVVKISIAFFYFNILPKISFLAPA